MKKIIILALTLFLLTGCQFFGKDNNPLIKKNDNNYYELLKNYKVKDKNINNTVDSKEFDEFLDRQFVDAMESDYTTMHFSVIDYKKYRIEKPQVDLGIVSYEENDDDRKSFEDALDELHSFDYDSLSYRQQYDYEALEYSLYETLAIMPYNKYTYLFGGSTDTLSNIISILSDFTFYDKESLDDYMVLVKDVDRYLDDCLAFTEKQRKDKIYMSDYQIDNAQEYASNFLSKSDDNVLIKTFDKRIDELSFLSQEEKDKYKKENKETVLSEVFDGFENVFDTLDGYRGYADSKDIALYKYSKDYAAVNYMLDGSTNKSIDEVFTELKDFYDMYEAELVSIIYEDEDAYNQYVEMYYDGSKFPTTNMSSKEILDFMKDNIGVFYPEIGDVEYNVDELDPETADPNAIAYYWPAPIDDTNQNIIRTNPNNLTGDPHQAYTTLAHEGLPGHLYQHIYYLKSNPHNFRETISFIGYTEGWAVRAQCDAMQFAGLNENVANILCSDTYDYFLYYSILDIGINYYGWDKNDVMDFFENTIFLQPYAEEGTAEMFIDFLTDLPGVYCNYGIGYMNMTNLRQKAMNKLGDQFDLIKFNETVLKNGPLPFNILEKEVDEYILGN